MDKKHFKIQLNESEPIYVGMDVHKNKWTICIIHQDEVIEKHTIPGKYLALKPILSKYKNHKIYSVYEAGFSGFYLHYYLKDDNIQNIVVAVNKIPIEIGNLVKTDRRDAKKLAFCLSKGLLRGIDIPSKELINYRQILRTRENYIKTKRTLINRIKMLLLQIDIPYDGRGLTNKSMYEILQKEIPEHFKYSLDFYFQDLRELETKVRQLEKMAENEVKNSEYAKNYQILRSVPGFGPITACSLCFEIGDFKRFQNAKKLAAFIGVTPREYSSGEHVYRGRITGQGRPALRSYLVEACWRAIAKDPVLKLFYNRIKANTGSGKKAIVAVARKLVTRIHSLIINEQFYHFGEINNNLYT